MIPDEEFLKGTPGDVKNIPVGRAGTTEECANAVTMLCKTGYMTGQYKDLCEERSEMFEADSWLTGQSLLLSGGLK